MITLTFAQRENIGFQYVLDTLRPNSPYGAERVRELRPFTPEEKPELVRTISTIMPPMGIFKRKRSQAVVR